MRGEDQAVRPADRGRSPQSRPATGAAYVSAMSDWIEREYLIDVYEMKREFANVDGMDRNSIGVWLKDHPYLSTNDVCRVAGVSLKTDQRWRQAAGLPRARRRWPPGWRRRPSLLEAPPDWGDGWLEQQYAAGWGLRTIARAVGRSYTAVRRRLRRRGVAFRTAREAVRSRHPCCTRNWLLVNYVAREQSLTACARLAGVSKYTLTAWLNLHRIRVRGASEQLILHYGGL
jgi:Helix-turn-helix domain